MLKSVLRHMYFTRCIGGKHTSRENVLKCLPKDQRGQGKSAIDELIKRNYIIPKTTSYGEQISLNPNMIRDIQIILNPTEQIDDKPPLEDSLNSHYEKRPFEVTIGDKEIKGIRAKYSYHKNIYDKNRIIAYVVVDGKKKSSIDLGSFNDPESLLYTAVKKIDAIIGARPFTKPDLYSLGKDIEGNRQPPKAIVDMLLYFGYVIPKGKRRWQRTIKELPAPPLDAFKKDEDKGNAK